MDGKGEAEAEAEAVEFPEWEFLHNSSNSNPNPNPNTHTHTDHPLDLDPQLDSALIRPDHFSLHPNSQPNSSSNSSTDPSEVDRNFDDSYVANQLFPDGEMYLLKQPSSPSSSPTSTSPQIWNDSDSEDKKMTVVLAETTTTATTTTTQPTTSSELLAGAGATGDGGFDSKEEGEEVEQLVDRTVSREEEKEERRVVWWKVPFEVFKYWVTRVSPVPVWSLSVAAAAAFLGLVILGRRLYKMKRKPQTLKLNVALDDKKVSQLMGRVARLNEAFSVVRRVPVVRPSLPASNLTLRPVMSMR